MKTLYPSCMAVVMGIFPFAATAQTTSLSVETAGLTVTPHLMADSMRYRLDAEPAVGARVQLFLRNNAAPETQPILMDARTRVLFNGEAPAALLAAGAWAWHDTPSATPDGAISLPSGAMTVWTFNGRTAAYGPGSQIHMEAGQEGAPFLAADLILEKPLFWLSAVTFLGPETAIQPDSMVVHIVNDSDTPVEMRSCRLWLPPNPRAPRVVVPQPALPELGFFNGHGVIPAGDRGGFTAKTGMLPLTYAVVEVSLAKPGADPFSLWAYVRVKPERFDISGGWINPANSEPYLKTLKRLHVNTAHMAFTPGYSDTDLYARYPLKYFNKLTPIETYDTDEMLPRIHAVEFLGEPQYGGGRPVPPQEVWRDLQPYTVTRLATTVTHSEERIWRDYAGLCDYPHYDAYRVTAPSPDAWRKYDRWKGQSIRWGAPLETIGDMCRSLRELNRPAPCAIWSQGPHDGWDGVGGRERSTPTPDEIRMQAWHAVSTRVTSLYWFNLSLKSLIKWRDTLDELGRIGRELRMLDEFILEGDAYAFERLTRLDGALDWDIASVCGPRAALLFALDLDYVPDPVEKVFKFGPPRPASWPFSIPAYQGAIMDVFRVDADGVRDVEWTRQDGAIKITDTACRVCIYVASPDGDLRNHLEEKRQRLLVEESALQFDPALNDADFQILEMIEKK